MSSAALLPQQPAASPGSRALTRRIRPHPRVLAGTPRPSAAETPLRVHVHTRGTPCLHPVHALAQGTPGKFSTRTARHSLRTVMDSTRTLRGSRKRATRASPSRAASWKLAAAAGADVSGSPSDVTPPASSETFEMWDSTTSSLTACSTVANLLMMMPQILKNAGSLAAGNPQDLAGLSWIAFSTGYLGNMLLLSYFTEQKQASACLVQVVGAASTLTLLTQIWMAGFMPPLPFAAVVCYFLIGCLANALRFTGVLPQALWGAWQDLVGVLGLSVLPQVLWSSFSPTPTPLPGIFAALAGVGCIVAIRTGSAPKALVATWQKLSGWTATLLFMFMPVAQLQACLANPANLGGLSPISNILGLIGNGLMIPRALFTRDLIWFTGSTWGAMMMGWGMLCAMTVHSFFPVQLFGLISVAFFVYLAVVLVMNAKAHSLGSPLASILYLQP